MEGIKNLEDSLVNKIEEEILKREELIKKLGAKAENAALQSLDTKEYTDQIREKHTEKEQLTVKLEHFLKFILDTSEKNVTTENKNWKKKIAVSAEPTDVDTTPLRRVAKSSRSKNIIRTAIKKNELMKHLGSNQISELVECMEEVECDKNELIIREGEDGFKVYVIEDGKAEVTKNGKVLPTLGPGQLFGELAILFNSKRSASVRALTKCKLWAIDRHIFQTTMKNTGITTQKEYIEFLLSVPRLKELPQEALFRVADSLEENHYESGEYIIRQGARGELFFIISRGQVDVLQRANVHSDEKFVRTLTKGEYFGEKALLRDDIRTASVIAGKGGADCLCLDREAFQKFVRQAAESTEEPAYKPDEYSKLRKEKESNEFKSLFLGDLSIIQTLGVGGFGRVELVYIKKNKPEDKTYALKVLKKHFIKETQQVEHVRNERHILNECDNMFIVKLYRTFKDRKRVYMLMDVCLGGELWTILRNRGSFDNETTKFYTSCVVLALEYLHKRGIVYRDLKPENLLLDKNGYIKLVDFGFAKKVGISKTWTFCGTPEYVAPEIILNKGHNTSADLWSLGILIYEMNTGMPPFSNPNHAKTYGMILKGIDRVEFPEKIDRKAVQIIKKFCKLVPYDRLGCGGGGFDDIQKQRWFTGYNWEGLKQGKLQPPIIPKVKNDRDASAFDHYDSESDDEDTPEERSGWDKDF